MGARRRGGEGREGDLGGQSDSKHLHKGGRHGGHFRSIVSRRGGGEARRSPTSLKTRNPGTNPGFLFCWPVLATRPCPLKTSRYPSA